MGLKCGIVGFPNVGKSSLFNKLCGKQAAEVANYPFCTIEPNSAWVPVKDKRLIDIANKSEKTIFSLIQFVDIAGLVKNASEGEGLGNKFLSHISEVDLILHVVRTFRDEEIMHVMDRIDPMDDLEIIQTELRLADLNKIRKAKEKKLSAESYKVLSNAENELLSQSKISDHELLKPYNLLSTKPFMVLINGPKDQELVDYCQANQIKFICMDIFQEESIDELINLAYDSLGLIDFFTVGPKEARAWAVKKGAKAVEAAGKIHTDFSKKFIRAEVTKYEDYIAGKKFKLEGKDYSVQSGDVINFRIGQ